MKKNILNTAIFAVLMGLCCLSGTEAQAQPRIVNRNYPLAANIARLSGLPEWYVNMTVPATASIRAIDGNDLTGFNLTGTVTLTFLNNNIKITWSVTANVAPGQTQPTITLSETTSISAGWLGYSSESPQSTMLSTPEQFELEGIDPDQEPAPPQDPPVPPPAPPVPHTPLEEPHVRIMNAAGGEGGANGGGGGSLHGAPMSLRGGHASWGNLEVLEEYY